MKIIIVDDHVLFRMGGKLAMQKQPDIEVIGEAGNSIELLNLIAENIIPDIILLDIVLPDVSGIDIAEKLKKMCPEVKILVLSAEYTADFVEQMMKIGVEGYISKTSPIDEIVYALRHVMDGYQYFGRDISRVLYDIVVSKQKKQEHSEIFSERELEVIKLCGEGLLSKEVADRLNLSSRTIENYKNNIFKKLGINNTVELVRYAFREGILE
ncbi:MAG: response regulator transcription factor [Bacteroidales bacterium]|nr:response regulator transcription factor [Bacteroidales bacterium]